MSRFHTIESSPPGALGQGLRMITVKSPALQGRGDITVWVPKDCDPTDLPCVLLLHGVYGSHWAWALHGKAHLTAQDLINGGAIKPAILVMPSDGLWGDGSGYFAHGGQDFEAWITQDVIEATREVLALNENNPWFIAGLSMGGYGALRLGAKFPALFQGISGHSSITAPDQLKLCAEEQLASFEIDPTDSNLLHWMDKHRDTLPPLRLDCGREDLLIEHNRILHAALLKRGIDHRYTEFEGGHTWEYWSTHLKETLQFFLG
jgi:putative tributyrin esterase